MVTETDRLRGLQMGEAGHHRIRLALGEFHDAALQPRELGTDNIYCRAQEEPDICGHLVVARAASMEFLASIADQFGQARLDVHMHIFEFQRPVELSSLNFSPDLVQPRAYLFDFLITEYTDAAEHVRMGQ